MRNPFLPMLFALVLTGCVNLGAKPPERLLSLSAQVALDDGAARTAAMGHSLIVSIPETPKLLETNRIPVQTGDVSYAYLKDAQWSDQPQRLFRRLLSETIAAKTGRVLLDPAQFGGEPGTRLEGELLQFGIDARTREAVVMFDATMLAPDGSQVTKMRFSASRPVGAIEPEEAGRGLNDAANDVAGQVAAWIAGL